MLSVRLLSPRAIVPDKRSIFAAGLDLYIPTDVIIPSHYQKIVPLDIIFFLPHNTYGNILPINDLSRNGMDVSPMVIQQDDRENVQVVLYNRTDQDVFMKRGDRIAQIIVTPCIPTELKVYYE
jgi:dUTP pyrophosphatase